VRFQPFAAVEVAVVDETLRRDTSSPPAKVLVAVDVATKYCAPNDGASTPAAKVEVAVPLMAIDLVVVGARRPAALISHDFPKIADGSA